MAPKTPTFSYKKFFGSSSSKYVGVESKKLKELEKIDVVVGKLFKVHERHYKRVIESQRKSELADELARGRSEENKVESGKGERLKKLAKSLVKGALGLPHIKLLFETLLKLAAASWVAKNPQAALGIAKFLKWFFIDVIGSIAGFAVNNILDGLYQIIDGPILSKIFGILKLVVGLFALRYALAPWKIFKDLRNIWKNKQTIKNVWKGFVDGAKKGLKPAIEGVLKALPATASLFKYGLKRGLSRAILKVFGKGGLRFLTGIFRRGLARGLGRAALTATGKGGLKLLGGAAKGAAGLVKGAKGAASQLVGKGVAKTVGKIFSKIPIVGPLIGLAINLALGDPLDKAILKAVAASAGQALGAWVGGSIGTVAGSVVPIVGNLIAGAAGATIGGILGGLVGDFIADKAYDWFKKGSDTVQKSGEGDEPKLAAGGIVTKETKAIIGEAGPEAVIPLKELGSEGIVGSKILEPFKVIGSAILGTMFKVITSFGPLGVAIIPLLKTILAPSIKMFGLKALSTSGIQQNKNSASVKTGKIKKGKDNKKDKALIGDEKVTVLPSEKDSGGKKPDYKSRRNKSTSMRSLLADILNNIIQLDFASPAGATSSGGDPAAALGDTSGPVEPLNVSGGQKGAFKKIYDIAKRVGDPVPELTAAQAMFESGWLTSLGARMDNNPFGQTGSGTAGKVYSNGRYWARYRNLDDAVKAHVDRWATGTPLGGAGYASKGGAPIPGLLVILEKYAPGSENNHSAYISAVKRNLVTFGFDPNKKNPATDLKMQTGGVVGAAKTAVQQGKKGPASPPCASWVRMVLGMAGHPAAGKVTSKGDLDPEGTKYNGPNYAASFAGSDLGAVIRSQSALQPGDIVLHQNTYGSFPTGSVTHVSIASANTGKIYHQPTSGGSPKEGGIFNFKAGIRLGGSGSIGSADSSSGSDGSSGGGTQESDTDIWKEFNKHLKDLSDALIPATPLPTPAAPVGPKFEGLTVDQISQAYAKNTKPIIPLNNIIISGGNTSVTNVTSQDFSAFAPPDFNAAMNTKLNFTTKL